MWSLYLKLPGHEFYVVTLYTSSTQQSFVSNFQLLINVAAFRLVNNLLKLGEHPCQQFDSVQDLVSNWRPPPWPNLWHSPPPPLSHLLWGKALRKKGFCSLQEDSEDHMALTLLTRSLDFLANSVLSRSWVQSLKLVSSSMKGNGDLFIALVIFLHLR